MKRISIILFLLTAFVFAKAQYPIQQSVANAPNTIGKTNAWKAQDGLINGVFVDTTAANLKQIKAYPGAQIFTTIDSSFWLRNSSAKKWLKANSGAGSITSFTFLTDSSLIVCYADGSCDTIPINNFTNTVNNIIQNFNDSTVFNLNDSTLIICNGQGVCDTIHLGNSNTYSIFFDSTSNNYYAVTCDTAQSVCVGDSCYQHEVCDTILIPRPATTVYQNGVWIDHGIVEHGSVADIFKQRSLIHDTYLYTDFNSYTIEGRPAYKPPLTVQNSGWAQSSASNIAFNHQGGSWLQYPNFIDNFNSVDLRLNYLTRINRPTIGPYAGDTIGPMLNRIGYAWMTNSGPGFLQYSIDNPIAKQVGIMFHTLDTAYTDAVTIFGQQVPSVYTLNDSTLLSKRIAVFKTTGQLQFPQYTTGAFPLTLPTHVLVTDADGNIFQYPPGGTGGGGLLLSANNGLSVFEDTTVQLFGPVGTPATLLNNRYLTAADKTLNITFNSLAGTSGFNLSSSSTAATGNVQRLLDVQLSGANANSNQNTRSGFFNNAHTGTGSTNFGIDAQARDGSTNYGISTTAFGGSVNYGLNTTVTNSGSSNFGLFSSATGSTSTNYGAYIQASGGTNNYGIIVPDGGGNVGIGTSTPTATRLEIVDNSLAAANMVSITSTSTAAASNLQRGVSVSFSGANATASQETHAIHVSNTHTGSGFNYGIYSVATGGLSGNNWAIYGEVADGFGVRGASTSSGTGGAFTSNTGTAVTGTSTSGVGGEFISTSANALSAQSPSNNASVFAARFVAFPTSTNTVKEILRLNRQVSGGVGATGVGGSIGFYMPTDNGSAYETQANEIISKFTTVTNGSQTSQLLITGVTGAATQTWLTIGQSGYVKFRPMTVTEAGAIATAEGLMVFVSNTDATFTSVGLWIFQNGAWKAL